MPVIARFVLTKCKCGPQRIEIADFFASYKRLRYEYGPDAEIDGGVSCGDCEQELLRLEDGKLLAYTAKSQNLLKSE